ncbi:unnamed protein product [Mytilus edulis]|uniref:Uncharacterized protein n=1 Tax=Mytilus edulis TaxID=6550 RepID=A0A8S3SEY7_MYTED|nr:unnamed protein product [Mytilus edulis]
MREGEESSPIHLRRSLKKNQYRKKEVKRQLLTEDIENDKKMKREQLDRHTERIRPMCWGGKCSQKKKQLQEAIRKMEENHTNTVHILQGMIIQLEKEKVKKAEHYNIMNKVFVLVFWEGKPPFKIIYIQSNRSLLNIALQRLFHSTTTMDFKLRYDKITLYDLPDIHTPCDLCNGYISTKHEIGSMLNSIDQTASLDKDLAGIYHNLAHSSTQDGIRLLY